MQAFPHHYEVAARAHSDGNVSLESGNLPPLESAPPVQFGGEGKVWSPEDLLVAAVADCFVLTFRAIARASKLSWKSIRCEAKGTLDRNSDGMAFTRFDLSVRLETDDEKDDDAIVRLLEKAEKTCLVTRSLNSEKHLRCEIVR